MKKAASLLLIFLLFLSGCSRKTPGEHPTEGGAKPFALAMEATKSLDPLRAMDESQALVFDLVYDSLVYVDREMRPVPYLAESCQVSADGMTISFTLRDDVYWHDGAAFTAQDVDHTIGRIRAMGEACMYFDKLRYIAGITVKDVKHFDLSLTKPHVTVLNVLDFPIVPSHRRDLDTTMVGTGQYILASYTPQKNLTLKKNETWVLSDPPATDTITVQMVASAEDAAKLVKIGEVTAVATTAHAIGGLGIGENMQITHYPTLEYAFLGFNLDSPYFASAGVRHAFSAAMDREKIIGDVYLGYGSPACVPVPPASYMYIGEGDQREKDTEKAKSLLYGAGYSVIDGSMCREGEDGDTLYLAPTLLINEENEARQKIANILKEDLAALGISLGIQAVPFSEYVSLLQQGDFDLYLGGCLFSQDLSYDFLFGDSKGTENGYASARMEDALLKLNPQRSDETIRAAFLEFQEVFLEDMPLSGICFLDGALVHTASLRGAENLAASKLYRNIGTWYLE